jgi:flagellar protein FlaF
MLQSAEDEAARIRALGRNHDLWSMLVKDLALEGNGLAEPLKGELIALGLWSMRYSTLAILNKLSVAPLITVNRNIAEGLALQSTQPAAPANSVRADSA